MSISIGIDIGGTKCALSVGDCTADSVRILHREEFPTAGKTWQETLEEFARRIDAGDEFCAAVFRESALHLATILSYTIDILNPEVIVLGGVFMRQHERFMREIEPIIAREALPLALRACRIVPAGLSENIGDYAALAVANMEG